MEAIIRLRREAEQADAPEAVTKGNMTSSTNLDASATTAAPKNGLDKIGADIMAKVNACKEFSVFIFL